MSTSHHDRIPRSRQPRQPSALPDWMLNPPPPRPTVGDRLAGLVPGGAAMRRRWWAWQQRQRLYQRYPKTVKVIAFFVCWVVALALVLAVHGLAGSA